MSHTKKSVFFKNNTVNNKDYKIFDDLNENEYKDLSLSSKPDFEKYEDLDISKEWVSTSQLKNIDFSDFSQHTFFDSAVHKVIYAFNEISNFPYDKKESEIYKFFNKIDGYTNYVLESIYPKYVGSVKFSGNEKITVKDKKGFWLNDFDDKTKNNIGTLSLREGNASFRFWIDLSDCNASTSRQVIFKKVIVNNVDKEITDGYFCFVDYDNQLNDWYVYFCFCQNKVFKVKKTRLSNNKSHVTINLLINVYRQVDFEFLIDGNKSEIEKVYENIVTAEFSNNVEYLNANLIIGSGENQFFDTNTLNNFTGLMDEFIVKNTVSKSSEIKLEKDDNIFTNNEVLLYLKFNEPGGNHLNSSLVVDASGNKLHGIISDIADQVIEDTSLIKIENSLLSKEDKKYSPVIIGSFPGIVVERQKLISVAENYDVENSNIIFKLIPKHYFIDSSIPASTSERFDYDTTSANTDIIGIKNSKENSHLVNICLIWARHFDQLKLFVDSISNLFVFSYEDINKEKYVNFQIENLCKVYNIEYAELFDNLSTKNIKGQYLQNKDTISDVNIIKLQNILWKRILLNSQDILSSKGTKGAIQNLKNSLGFNFNRFINVTEKSYKNTFNVKDVNYSIKKDYASIYNMSFENFEIENITFDSNTGFPDNYPYLIFDNIMSFDKSSETAFKGLDNKWSLEVYFKLNDAIKNDRKLKESLTNKQQAISYETKQSILRLDVEEKCLMNLYLEFSSQDSEFCNLILDIDPLTGYRKSCKTIIENINPYDLINFVSVSFNFDKETDDDNDIIEIKLNYDKLATYDTNLFSKKAINKINLNKNTYSNEKLKFYKKENTRMCVGPYLYNIDLVNSGEINDIISEELTPVMFEGQICGINLWNKLLEDKEITMHKNDILNVSLLDIEEIKNSLICRAIKTIYNDFTSDNVIISLDNNISSVMINDQIKENKFIFYNVNNKNFKKEKINIAYQNIDFDNFSVNNNVLINNFSEEKNKELYNNFNEDQHRPNKQNSYIDQYNIDFSSSKIINDNIRKIYGSIDSFSKTLLGTKNFYSYEYHDLKKIRSVYFDNYKDLENIDNRFLLDIFKYFDNIMNNTVSEIIPSKIKYAGFNFVFESNILERSKYHHKNHQKTTREVNYFYKP